VLTSLQKRQLQRITSVSKRLSIEINVIEEHLKSGPFETNPESETLYEKTGLSQEEREP
jgi:hypothetical protein